MQPLGAREYPDFNTPQLHGGVIPGSLQLLGWLFLHPTAWKNYVTRIDPELRPDFGLLEISMAHWRHPMLRRLLVRVFIILPILAGGLTSTVLLLWGRQSNLSSLLMSITIGIVGDLLLSAIVGLLNLALGVILGLILGVFAGVASNILGLFIFGWLFDSGPPLHFLLACLLIGGIGGLITNIGQGITGAKMPDGIWESLEDIPRPMRLMNWQHRWGFISANQLTILPEYREEWVLPPKSPPYISNKYVVASITSLALGLLGIAIANKLIATSAASNQPSEFRTGLIILSGAGFGGGIAWTIAWISERMLYRRRAVLAGLLFGALSSAALTVFIFVDVGGHGLATPLEAILYGLLLALSTGIPAAMLLALFYAVGHWMGGSRIGAGTVGLSSSLAWIFLLLTRNPGFPLWIPFLLSGLGMGSGLLLGNVRSILLFPLAAVWSGLLYWLDMRVPDRFHGLLCYHAVFWDEFQRLPLPWLEQHLLLTVDRDPLVAATVLDYLSTRPQRGIAQAVQIEVDARHLERCANINALAAVYRGVTPGELDSPISALLRSFSRISQDLEVTLQQESRLNQRMILSTTEDRLDELLRELTRSSERYAVRFRPIATSWRRIVVEYREELTQSSELRQEIDSPYVIGVPLNDQQEIFVGRADVSARIEHLLLDRRRPPLLLYGQRRMGKTSLLNNLGRLLPSTIVPLFVDLQGPASHARDEAGFLYNLARGMIASAQRYRNLTLPPLSRAALANDPFTEFDEWCDEVEAALNGQTALLILDEFEVLEGVFNQGRFNPVDLLGMLRYMIQHRLTFRFLLSGSHTLEEFQIWSSYLINVQVIKLNYLQENEALQLIERPVNDFALWYAPEASQRVLELTNGHPFLLQLLCSEIITYKNQQPLTERRLASIGDVESAAALALEHAAFFFGDLEYNQVTDAGRMLLRFIAEQGAGVTVPTATLAARYPHQLQETLQLLIRRDLIEPHNDGYRFQVELIRRWFARPTAP